MRNILDSSIYIAPYNDVSVQVKEYLNEYFENVKFCGFVDKFKTELKIEAKAPFVIIVSPNYFKNIHDELRLTYEELNIKFLYAIVINKHRVYFTSSYYIYSLYSILIKSKSYFKRLFNNHLYKNSYFLPKFLLKYLGIKELQKDRAIALKEVISDEWLTKNKDLHKGKRCFILATGPSLNELDLSKLKDEYTIGVNGIYKIAKEIDLDYYIYVSNWYWKHHVNGMKSVSCKRRFLPTWLKDELDSDVATSWINTFEPKYYSKLNYPLPVPSFFSQEVQNFFSAGGSVVFLGLQLAYHLGFEEVIIVGLDHTYKKDDYKNKKHGGYVYNTTGGDKAHFDSQYMREGVDVHVDLEAMENAYIISKSIYENNKKTILNASPGTMLDIFKKVDYESLF